MMCSKVRLAAARRADEHADLAGAERKVEVDEHDACRSPGRVRKRLARDVDLKRMRPPPRLAGVSNGCTRAVSITSITADEGQRIGEQTGDIEQLESDADLEADAVRAAQQFDNQHDLPYQREAAIGRRPRSRARVAAI